MRVTLTATWPSRTAWSVPSTVRIPLKPEPKTPEAAAEAVKKSVAVTAKADAQPAAKAAAGAAGADNKAALALLSKYSCTACHAIDHKVVGPSFQDVAKKHAGKVDYLAAKIKSGGSGVWGPIPMPAQSLSDAEAKTIATWLAAGAAK